MAILNNEDLKELYPDLLNEGLDSVNNIYPEFNIEIGKRHTGKIYYYTEKLYNIIKSDIISDILEIIIEESKDKNSDIRYLYNKLIAKIEEYNENR